MRAEVICLGATAAFILMGVEGVSLAAASQSSTSPAQTTRLPVKTAAKPVDENTPAKAIKLSLADAIFIALRDNRTIQSAYADRITQKFSLRVTEDTLTPHFAISSNPQYQKFSNLSSSQFPASADSSSRAADITPNATVLLPTGATFGFAWANQVTDSSGTETRSSAAQFSLTQPLLRGGGVDYTMAPIRTARLGEAINLLNLKQTVSQTIGQVILAYRALLQAQEAMKLARASMARSQDLVEVNRALINAGRMASVEIVQSEMDVENQRVQLLQASKGLDDARLALLNMLSLDLGGAVVADEDTEPKRVKPDFPTMLKIALGERPDYASQLLVVEQSKIGIVVAGNQKLWDLSLFANGTYGRHTVAGIPGLQKVSGQAAGISLSIPLNDLQREQPYVQATTLLKTSQLQLTTIRQGLELQVRSAVAEADIAWQQLEAGRRAQQLAQKAVEIEKDKLRAGRSSNFQVRSLQSDLRSADEQKLNAIITYLNALTTLDLGVGTTLKTWQITLRD
jgi:outer membrane protein TolC